MWTRSGGICTGTQDTGTRDLWQAVCVAESNWAPITDRGDGDLVLSSSVSGDFLFIFPRIIFLSLWISVLSQRRWTHRWNFPHSPPLSTPNRFCMVSLDTFWNIFCLFLKMCVQDSIRCKCVIKGRFLTAWISFANLNIFLAVFFSSFFFLPVNWLWTCYRNSRYETLR